MICGLFYYNFMGSAAKNLKVKRAGILVAAEEEVRVPKLELAAMGKPILR